MCGTAPLLTKEIEGVMNECGRALALAQDTNHFIPSILWRRFSCCGCAPLLALESGQTVLLLCRRTSSALRRALCVQR